MNINDYIGLPFCEKGRSLDDGFDCWGLIQHFYVNELGVYIPDETECYEKTTDRRKISERIKKQKKNWVEIEEKDRKEYDVVLMNRLGVPMHVGLLVGLNDVLHIEGVGNSISKCVSLSHITIKNSVVGFYRHGCLL